ncbi:glycosyltransferase family 4 protein [Mongoliimonas terrestris]|uniref:glycosyltransferase family 4 protein n=1 Tax=Mongoliimonas terrestris TaxID=1709001 RepID=UPI000949A43A|nr:glycosyltransferase family 4 protein [Mongoliimonas terrestris]
MPGSLRVAVLSHGHPRLSPGGAEIASHGLARALRTLPRVESLFVGCAPGPGPHAGSALSGLADDPGDVVFHPGPLDGLFLTATDRDPVEDDLLPVLAAFRPDVVHLHHGLGFGIDLVPRLRRALPDAALVVTLHEYVALCHQQGQMVKAASLDLCDTATPAACHGCFPSIPAGRFALRAALVGATLGTADHLLAPSRFLADRFLAHGFAADRFSVLPNGLSAGPTAPAREGVATGATRPVRFGFFGQINPYKGVDVLLDAVARIPDADWPAGAELLVAGCHLEKHPPAFQAKVQALLAAAGPRVRLHGAYANADLPGLMATVDWVVVPSIWWENAPLVIEEAFLHGRPVIASGIGGMAERVRDGVDGLLVRPRDPAALADALVRALSTDGLWPRLAANIRPPVPLEEAAARHLELYRSVIARRAGDALAATAHPLADAV